jgi:hypothetical protein
MDGCMYMLYAYVSYFTNVHICIMGAQSWDGAQTAQNILDVDGNPMFVGISIHEQFTGTALPAEPISHPTTAVQVATGPIGTGGMAIGIGMAGMPLLGA